MAKTATDLAKAIAQELNVLDANGELSSADDSYIKSVISDELESLPGMGVNVFWDQDDTPAQVFRPLVRYLATCVPAFGIVADENERELRLRRLRSASKDPYVGDTVKAVYY